MSQFGDTSLRLVAAPIIAQLAQPGVSEICINEPGVMWVETRGQFQRCEAPELTFEMLCAIGTLAAYRTGQDVGPTRPLVATTFPNGERTQIVMPPAVGPGKIAFSLRKPSTFEPDIDFLAEKGLFAETRAAGNAAASVDAELVRLRDAGDWKRFLQLAVYPGRKNIGIVGPTFSGKTTLMKALVKGIPDDERLISIEDTPELNLRHSNCVQLQYSKGGQGTATVGASDLLEATLRMCPSRVLMGELRDGAAFTYVRAAAAGHPGSIATWHAKSAGEARHALALMIKQHEAGRQLTDETIYGMLHQFIDVIVFCEHDHASNKRYVREVLFEPEKAVAV